jgi:hypothetical protein
MRVLFARRSKDAHTIVVDSHGRARPAGVGAGSLKIYGLAAAGALIAIAPMTGPGEALIASGRAAAQSAADFIRARSPGLRTQADLVKTKVRRAQPAQRTARALPRVRRPAGQPAVALLAPPPLPLAFDSAPLAPAFQPVVLGPVPPLEYVGGVPCCFAGFNPPLTTSGGFPIGGGGGGPGPPPPGVPEPSAWTMMILGFTFLGTAWRRRRMLLKLVRELPRLFHERMLLLAYARVG